MKIIAILCCCLWTGFATAQTTYHTPPTWTIDLMQEQHQYALLSPLVMDDGRRVTTAHEWNAVRRPQLLEQWTKILGKLEPDAVDKKWFGDITKAVEVRREKRDGYTRIELQLPMETDFLQPHVLLIPDNAQPGKCPAVIAWTSTGPDYAEPEKWWGAWLAQHGCVVLTGWSFICNYRDATSYRNGASEKVYERFGHWLPMSKMVHDVQREAEFLRSLPEVDAEHIGFIGFSLSAKSALYVAAFAPEICATVSIDPHLALHGDSNYHDPWYLDWKRPFDDIQTDDYPVKELRGTTWSLLDRDPTRPGFEHDHHELLALAAPRALMVIGCSTDKETATHSDDRQSVAYVAGAKEVYELLNVPARFEYVPLTCGHQATSSEIDAAWQRFFRRWLPGIQ
ncbi:MAG: dienelactone hydrolase family protein [Fuerstia sp.]|nr:dienelactone hydrolase family protein [Fuerstiella sp.]